MDIPPRCPCCAESSPLASLAISARPPPPLGPGSPPCRIPVSPPQCSRCSSSCSSGALGMACGEGATMPRLCPLSPCDRAPCSSSPRRRQVLTQRQQPGEGGQTHPCTHLSRYLGSQHPQQESARGLTLPSSPPHGTCPAFHSAHSMRRTVGTWILTTSTYPLYPSGCFRACHPNKVSSMPLKTHPSVPYCPTSLGYH